MPTYIYETTDLTKAVRELEIKQGVHDDPLAVDPASGEAVRRIISAGYSILVRGTSTGPCVGSAGSDNG
jgi:predicted nucleic acid-binding Zn ribbon protein